MLISLVFWGGRVGCGFILEVLSEIIWDDGVVLILIELVVFFIDIVMEILRCCVVMVINFL